MDVREKLVELIDDFIHDVELKHWYSEELDEKLADDLIANGVTVQKWIPVTERLPEYGEIVLAFGKRHATSGQFRGVSRTKPNLWHWKGNTIKEVSHWMPLPEPPNE